MSTTPTTSSPTSSSSSSSVYPRTPSSSHVTTPTDHATSPYPSSHVVTGSGLARMTHEETTTSDFSTPSSQWVTEESSIQATPSSTDIDPDLGPLPSLPPAGFKSDGSRDDMDSVAVLIGQTPDKEYHPDVGPLPPQPPQGQLRSSSHPTINETAVLLSLQEKVRQLEESKAQTDQRNKALEKDLHNLSKHFLHMQEQLKQIVMERDYLASEKDKNSAIIRHLESQLSILRQGGGGKTAPTNRLLSPNLHAVTAQPRLENRRLTDPYFKEFNGGGKYPPPQHRPSDSNIRYLSHHQTTRPNNLPLGIAPGNQYAPPSFQDTPLPLDVRVPPTRMYRQSPGSDSSADGLTPNYFKVSKISVTKISVAKCHWNVNNDACSCDSIDYDVM